MKNKTADSIELKAGDKAPDFAHSQSAESMRAGREVSLAELRGKKLVLYFYPKDDTPGCTAQACGLRDAWKQFEGGAEIFGVSTDPVASHEKFIAKYRTPLPASFRPGTQNGGSVRHWVEKNMYGKKYMGTERSTFVIDGDGRLAKIFRKVKPEEHVDLLLEALS